MGWISYLWSIAMSAHESEKQGSETEKQTHEVHVHTETVFTDDALDPVYQAKARILNDAIQEIGMGRYQWCVLSSPSCLLHDVDTLSFLSFAGVSLSSLALAG